MREKHLFVLCMLSAVVLCASVCTFIVFAKAPDTAKIVFTSTGIPNKRDHHYYGYRMDITKSTLLNTQQMIFKKNYLVNRLQVNASFYIAC